MNCTEFQNTLMQEPTCTEAEFLRHASDCDPCREQYEHTLKFEALLLNAMELETPTDLTERVLRAVQASEQHAATARLRKMALAVGLMLLFVVAGWMGFQWGGRAVYAEKLPQLVSQHMEKERRYLRRQGRLSDAYVAQLFSRFGVVMHSSVGGVVFAEPCWIRKRRGMHLILREGSDSVTLMFMPGEYIADSQNFAWGQFSGLIIAADYGSLAIVAASPEVVDQMRQRISVALMWST